MRSLGLLLLLGACGTTRDPILDALSICKAYHEQVVVWIDKNDIPEWPDDRGDARSLYGSGIVRNALKEMVVEMPPPRDPWGEALLVVIYNETLDGGWLPALRVMSKGPNQREDLGESDDIYYPSR